MQTTWIRMTHFSATASHPDPSCLTSSSVENEEAQNNIEPAKFSSASIFSSAI